MRAVALGLGAAMLVSSAGARADDAWSIYLRSSASVYASAARTIGGSGGAVGLRWGSGPWLAQSDVGFLIGLGNVMEWRLAGGIEGTIVGRWSPALLATFSLLAGDQTSILDGDRTLPIRGPAGSLGLDLAPLRFVYEGTTVSSLQLGAGLGSDFPGLGVALRIGFFELTASL